MAKRLKQTNLNLRAKQTLHINGAELKVIRITRNTVHLLITAPDGSVIEAAVPREQVAEKGIVQ